MPYPESCPECGGAFRNTGTHYTARRNEVGRHVLLELGCQNTQRRYWWDFTRGTAAEDSTTPGRRSAAALGSLAQQTNGHVPVATLDPPMTTSPTPTINGSPALAPDEPSPPSEPVAKPAPSAAAPTPGQPVAGAMHPEPASAALRAKPVLDEDPVSVTSDLDSGPAQPGDGPEAKNSEIVGPSPVVPPSLKEAFVRQLQLDRLTLRQMRTWLMADEARRAMEVAAGATEATYERLALILFGSDLPQLLGKQPAPTPPPGMSAEERLELQREKARIRARLRRAAAKAKAQQS